MSYFTVFILFILFLYVLFFVFKQKTAYEMRISDWSSDVCASDLIVPFGIAFSCADPMPPYPNGRARLSPSVSIRHASTLIAPVPNRSRLAFTLPTKSSDERRVGKECVSTCRYGWRRYN